MATTLSWKRRLLVEVWLILSSVVGLAAVELCVRIDNQIQIYSRKIITQSIPHRSKLEWSEDSLH